MTLGQNTTRLGQRVAISTAGERAEAYVPQALPPIPPVQLERLYSLLICTES